MSAKFPLEKKDLTLEMEDNHDEPKALGGSYNEEMSRAAVGLLFDDDDDDDNSKDTPEPVSYVSGFERNPTSRRPRREALAEAREEAPPPPKPKETAPRPAPPEQPEERSRSRRATTRIMEGGGATLPREPREARPPRDRERGRPPERERDRERPPERSREREKEHILERERTPESDREQGREREPGRERGRRPAGATGPVPAVRTNVKTERPAPPPEGRPRRDPRNVPAPIEDGYDNFRQRYNPDELISSPRNPGKPKRRGQPADGRGNFGGYGGDGPNIIRWVAIGSAAVFIILMVVLIFQVNSLAGQRNYYRDIAESIDNETSPAGPSQLELYAMEETIDIQRDMIADLRNRMIQAGLDPDAPVLPPNFGGQPSEGGSELPPQAPEPTSDFPREITINPGDSLSRIANRYYGSNTQDIIAMIANYNGLANPNDIRIGQTLTLPPLP